MYFHTAHPQSLPRYAKHSDYSLDTSAESDDSGLQRGQPAMTADISCKVKHSLCRNFTEHGFCSYGRRCQFAHGLEELRYSSCSNPSYKTRVCLAFARDGFCFYGQRCNFIHQLPSVQDQAKWRQIYRNFRQQKDMFKSTKETSGRLMQILDKDQD